MPTGGPFVKAALLCENLIEDKEGVLSFIRVIDRVVWQAVGPGAPAEMPPIRGHPLVAVFMFVSGAARGSFDVRLSLQNPSGLSQDLGTTSILLEGEERGANLIARLSLTFEHQGLYWLDAHLDGDLLARVPLRVIYSRTLQPSPTP